MARLRSGTGSELGAGLRAGLSLWLGLCLSACVSVAPGPSGLPSAVHTPPPGGTAPASIQRSRSSWVASSWAELPGWEQDSPREWLPAMLRSCERPAAVWGPTCAALRHWPAQADDADLRQWLQSHLQPMQVISHEGKPEGLLTGYYEPLLVARRQAAGEFRVPIHAPPADLASRRPWWSREDIDTLAAPQSALRGKEIAYLRHPLDLLVLQIQGSGRLSLTEADGSTRLVRVAFAGHNDRPYQSVGKWLIERGELRPSEASWPGIRAWAMARPQRVQELMWVNPRYVFFREEPLPDPALGPKGAQGVALSPGRSIAVDPLSIPYGTPLWLSSTDPLGGPPIQRSVVAQDTGSAIVGAVRADYFAGWGELAEAQAGRMKQPLRLWVLWPRQMSVDAPPAPPGTLSSAAP